MVDSELLVDFSSSPGGCRSFSLSSSSSCLCCSASPLSTPAQQQHGKPSHHTRMGSDLWMMQRTSRLNRTGPDQNQNKDRTGPDQSRTRTRTRTTSESDQNWTRIGTRTKLNIHEEESETFLGELGGLQLLRLQLLYISRLELFLLVLCLHGNIIIFIFILILQRSCCLLLLCTGDI